MTEIIHLLNQYGYIILFLSLMLELIFVPVPNEALMSYVGLLCYQGKMNIILSILFAGAGGFLGVTISYWIGYKLGAPFIRRFGHYIHLGPEKLEKMSRWYGKYGKVLLIVSYFIPGIRHVASITSGVIKLPYRSFSIFSTIGVFLWIGTFITLGKVFGPQLDKYQGEIKKWLVLFCIVIGFILVIYFLIRANREVIKESLLLLYEVAFKRVKSFLKIKVMILCIFVLFVGCFTLMVGLIQDFISNEFDQFNVIFKTVVFLLFNAHWSWFMHLIYLLSSWIGLGIVAVLTVIVILINRTNRWLELRFYVLALIGTYLFTIGIRWLFHFMLSGSIVSADFPNEQAIFLSFVYGFFLFMIIRHHKRDYLFMITIPLLFILILALYFVSAVYLHKLPSDLFAGYVFGAVWVTGVALALEMFRLLAILKD